MPREKWYIEISGWDRFQHYGDREPTWIKNYVRLLSDDAYTDLSMHRRGVLHGLWMEYARSRRRLPDDTPTLCRRLGQRVFRADLEALSQAGFIEFVASDLLALNALARGEKRREDKEEEKRGTRARTRARVGPPDEGNASNENGFDPERAASLVAEEVTRKSVSPQLRGSVTKRVKQLIEDEGMSEADVRGGLRLMNEKGKVSAGILDSFVVEAMQPALDWADRWRSAHAEGRTATGGES